MKGGKMAKLKFSDTKGLSAVVTTLIIILLVLIAVGIVWFVVNNLIGGTGETINYASNCVGLSFEGIAGDGNVTVTRMDGSAGNEIDGVYINNEVCEGNIAVSKVCTGLEVSEGDDVTVKPYFDKEDGTDYICN